VSSRAARRQRALDRLRTTAGVTLSAHAKARRVEHGFSEDDVLLTIARPEQTYGSPASYSPDRRLYQRGRVCAVVDERTRVVVTVLPRIAERWEHPAPG
jgi:hypothetical protein